MPDAILDVVSAAVEVVKENEKKPQARIIPGDSKPLPKTLQEFKSVDEDIKEALKPGERYLTPEEAAERRKKIIEARQAQGLPVSN